MKLKYSLSGNESDDRADIFFYLKIIRGRLFDTRFLSTTLVPPVCLNGHQIILMRSLRPGMTGEILIKNDGRLVL